MFINMLVRLKHPLKLKAFHISSSVRKYLPSFFKLKRYSGTEKVVLLFHETDKIVFLFLFLLAE